MGKVIKFLIVVISLILSVGCSPQARLSNLLSKHPELIKRDTVFRSDTIWTKSVQKDTVFRTQITKDTVIIRENNLTVKYFNDGKTTYIKGKCDTVRIIREIPVEVNSVEAKSITWAERAWRKFKDILIVFLLGGIVILLIVQKKILD